MSGHNNVLEVWLDCDLAPPCLVGRLAQDRGQVRFHYDRSWLKSPYVFALATLGARQLTIGRELTKQFEEIATVNAEAFPAWLAHDANRLRGEFVLVLHPAPAAAQSGPDSRVLELLLPHLPLKTAVKLASEISGESRNALYELALRLKKD